MKNRVLGSFALIMGLACLVFGAGSSMAQDLKETLKSPASKSPASKSPASKSPASKSPVNLSSFTFKGLKTDGHHLLQYTATFGPDGRACGPNFKQSITEIPRYHPPVTIKGRK